MHDPLTVAFRLPGVTVWHKDPEVLGDDDSCSRGNRIIRGEYAPHDDVEDWERARWLESWHQRFKRAPLRDLVVPWRWHVWHWKLQIHALQNLKRWLWTRCNGCGERFPWGYAPTSTQWRGTGPRWFRSEEHVYHHDCTPTQAEVEG